MTLYVDIQGALENALLDINGIPDLAPEGVSYTPVVGTPYMTAVIVPVSGKPDTMGDENFKLHEGLFMITLSYPNGRGLGEVVAMADNIKNAFQVNDTFTQNSTIVRVRYAERRPHLLEPDWIRLPIEIFWYIFSTEN